MLTHPPLVVYIEFFWVASLEIHLRDFLIFISHLVTVFTTPFPQPEIFIFLIINGIIYHLHAIARIIMNYLFTINIRALQENPTNLKIKSEIKTRLV